MKRTLARNSLALAGLMVILALAANGAHAGKKALRVGAEPGAKVLYRLERQSETTFAGMMFTENASGDVDVEALDKDADNNQRFSVSFANFEASVMQGGNMTERDPQLNGVVVHVTMSPRGEQLELTPQSNLPKAQRDLVEGVIDALFAYLPENEVDRDDTWTRERKEEADDEDAAPAIEGEIEFMLEDFDKQDGHECAKLYVQGEVKVRQPTPQGPFEGKAKTEGEMFVAVSGGHVVKSKLTTETTGNVGQTEVSRADYLEVKMREK